MGMAILIVGTMNAFKFGAFGLFFGLLMLLFFNEIIKTGAHRVLLVLASTLFFALWGFAEIAKAGLNAMG